MNTESTAVPCACCSKHGKSSGKDAIDKSHDMNELGWLSIFPSHFEKEGERGDRSTKEEEQSNSGDSRVRAFSLCCCLSVRVCS